MMTDGSLPPLFFDGACEIHETDINKIKDYYNNFATSILNIPNIPNGFQLKFSFIFKKYILFNQEALNRHVEVMKELIHLHKDKIQLNYVLPIDEKDDSTATREIEPLLKKLCNADIYPNFEPKLLAIKGDYTDVAAAASAVSELFKQLEEYYGRDWMYKGIIAQIRYLNNPQNSNKLFEKIKEMYLDKWSDQEICDNIKYTQLPVNIPKQYFNERHVELGDLLDMDHPPLLGN